LTNDLVDFAILVGWVLRLLCFDEGRCQRRAKSGVLVCVHDWLAFVSFVRFSEFEMTEQQVEYLEFLITSKVIVWYCDQGHGGWHQIERIVRHDGEIKAFFVGGHGKYADLYAASIDMFIVTSGDLADWPVD
jgi:hypothetical protein